MNRITLATLALSIAACTSSQGSATATDYEDVAQTITTTLVTSRSPTSNLGVTGGDVIVFREALDLAHGRLPTGFIRDDDHRCHGSHDGVAHDITIVCKNAAGTTLARCDDTTDSATITLKQTGMLQTPNYSSSIDREGTFSITGLQSATATFAGSSSFTLDSTFMSTFHPGVTKTLSFDATAAYDALTFTTQDRQLTGGSASFEVKAHHTVTGSGSGNVDKSFDVTAKITFNANHTATLVLDGTQTFTIDLTTGQITKV